MQITFIKDYKEFSYDIFQNNINILESTTYVPVLETNNNHVLHTRSAWCLVCLHRVRTSLTGQILHKRGLGEGNSVWCHAKTRVLTPQLASLATSVARQSYHHTS